MAGATSHNNVLGGPLGMSNNAVISTLLAGTSCEDGSYTSVNGSG